MDGARQMLAAALQAEVAAYVDAFVDQVDADGHRLVVRNGYHHPREVSTAIGAVPVRAPRVNDERVESATGKWNRFASAILPERGGMLRVRNMRRDWFNRVAAEVGVAGLTPRELRHTAASMEVSAGASVLALQRMLGHEKPSVTLDVHSGLFDEDLDAVAGILPSARSRILADPLRTHDVQALQSSASEVH